MPLNKLGTCTSLQADGVSGGTGGQVNRTSEVDRNKNLNVRDDVKVPNEDVAYRRKLVDRLAQFGNMVNAHLGLIKAVTLHIEIDNLKDSPIHSASY